ncbi:MAG: amidohydrolase family protein, partial [Lentisphaeria bacterium]|nr:amidohydrolase family protein [Lentisphaeria bacterium]
MAGRSPLPRAVAGGWRRSASVRSNGGKRMDFDLLIRGGSVIDGTGAPARRADVGVGGDTIAAVGDLSGAAGKTCLDASGLVVAPGFIDIHNHAHNEAEGGILKIPGAENMVRMGVTTLIAGNCGGSPWPLDRHLEAVAQASIRQNYGILVGHGTIRARAGVRSTATASPEQLESMRDLAREGMDAGAFGMSTGYFTQSVTLEELVAVSQAVAERHGIYTSHIRTEGAGLLEAIDEAVAVGERARIPVQISHLKTYGRSAWPLVEQAIERIHGARERGIDVHADRYPYTASFTGITSLLGREIPAEAGARGGMKHLYDPDLLERARATVAKQLGELDGPGNVLLAPLRPRPGEAGKRLDEVASNRGLHPIEAAIALAVEGNCSCIFFSMLEENLERFYRDPYVWVGSDGHLRLFGEGVSHPRNYGTFPRALGRYGRELRCFTLEEADAKMTGLPAAKLG